MSHSQAIVVPRISTFPGHEAKARMILRWLAERRVVEALPTTCGRGVGGMAYAIGSGARSVVLHPERLPFGEPINGLEMVTKRCIYTPTRDFAEEAGCPECRREIGEALFGEAEELLVLPERVVGIEGDGGYGHWCDLSVGSLPLAGRD